MSAKLKVKVLKGYNLGDLGNRFQEFCDKLEDKEEFAIWHISNIVKYDLNAPHGNWRYSMILVYDEPQ